MLINTKAPLREITIRPTGRVFFVGDIHGEFDAFRDVLTTSGFDAAAGDIVVSVGDLVDRGAQSLEALRLLHEPWFYAVLGNHEHMAAKAIDTGEDYDWLRNGGSWFSGLPISERLEATGLLRLAGALPVLITVILPDGYSIGVTHAGLPGVDRYVGDGHYSASWTAAQAFALDHDNDELLSAFIWDRKVTKAVMRGADCGVVDGIDAVIHGHTIMEQPLVVGNRLYIDTGACVKDDGRLTMLEAAEVRAMLADSGHKADDAVSSALQRMAAAELLPMAKRRGRNFHGAIVPTALRSALLGPVWGSDGFEDGTEIQTSPIVGIFYNETAGCFAETQSGSRYILAIGDGRDLGYATRWARMAKLRNRIALEVNGA